ncbi:MAG: hypothetical protein ACYDD7_12575 [Acidimicrobiales bacterium]
MKLRWARSSSVAWFTRYDAAKLIAHGIRLAENRTPAGVRDCLEKVKRLAAATGAPGSMLNLGRWQRRAWFGPQYLVMREVLDGAADPTGEFPSCLVHRFSAT